MVQPETEMPKQTAEAPIDKSPAEQVSEQPQEAKPGVDAKQPTDAAADHQWPFPDREEIFLPPERGQIVSGTRSGDNGGAMLLGFVNVGQQRAILKIDGLMTPLAEGESRGDLRVLAINPPTVELQRGDRRWTERLYSPP